MRGRWFDMDQDPTEIAEVLPEGLFELFGEGVGFGNRHRPVHGAVERNIELAVDAAYRQLMRRKLPTVLPAQVGERRSHRGHVLRLAVTSRRVDSRRLDVRRDRTEGGNGVAQLLLEACGTGVRIAERERFIDLEV